MKRSDRVREMTATLNKESKDIPGIRFYEGDQYYIIWTDLTIPYDGKRATGKQTNLIKNMMNVRFDRDFPINLIGREAASYLIKAAFFVMSTGVNYTLCLRTAESASNPIDSETSPYPLQD